MVKENFRDNSKKNFIEVFMFNTVSVHQKWNGARTLLLEVQCTICLRTLGNEKTLGG